MEAAKQVIKLAKRVNKHFSDFLAMPYAIESFGEGPAQYFKAYLRGADDEALLATRCNEMHTWHFARYAQYVLKEEGHSSDELAMAVQSANAMVFFEEAFVDAGINRSLIIEYSAFFLSLNILAGWKEQAASVGMSIYRGIDTTLLGLRHNPDHAAGSLYRHFWFLLHLYCDSRGLPLDTSQYSYPEDMSPYSAVLADWRTTDLAKVQGFVNAMADFHLEQARPTKHDEVAEFDTEDRMLFPYEILAFLRLREWLGLANPTSFEHPLMQHPMARMPSPVPLPYPETPLLDAVVEKFKSKFPESFGA